MKTYNSKKYSQLTNMQKHKLATNYPEHFKAMREEHFASAGDLGITVRKGDARQPANAINLKTGEVVRLDLAEVRAKLRILKGAA